ncbi:hypothetical protein C0585_06690 [Candidatus Woesearchaeota archaeon]|nr:MAG: hypothetical protein C0585_06690 [Candidatus Woesearchaeota archaeon]
MELNILKEKEIPLLERKRVTATIASQEGKTPSRVDVIKAVAKKLKTKEENIVVRHIYSKFGSGIAKAIMHVYNDAKTKVKFERKGLLEKHVIPVEAPKEEEKAPEAAPVEEAPIEEAEPVATEEKAEEPKEE